MFEQKEGQKANVANLRLKISLPFMETRSTGLLGN